VLKPSEHARACAALIGALLPRYVDAAAFRVVQGAVPETTALLRERFDHIFYTGNPVVARIVMAAAVQHLTPVTFELGGKCPTVVHSDANLALAARRILSCKCLNAGQVCLAPDYILVQEDVADKLRVAIADAARTFYGADMRASADFGRIINDNHFRRITALRDGAGGTVTALGGASDPAEKYIGLTLIENPNPASAIMKEEIFGPLLPMFRYKKLDEAIARINADEKPLAAYVFSADAAVANRVRDETSSGGLVINDTMLHITIPELPFGGVGNSGMGAYHGQVGFDRLSHQKAVLNKYTWGDVSIRYPPYSPSKIGWISFLSKSMPAHAFPGFLNWTNFVVLGLSVAVVVLSVKLAQK
jgi:aldehyde dehydrogenase (NAD+)